MNFVGILLSSLLIWICPMFASPFTEFRKASEACSNKDFIAVLYRWVAYTGDYKQATLWSRTCRQHPEAITTLLRKLKEQLFKFENPPDIESYVRLMAESAIKSRISRAWIVYKALLSDKRQYGPEDRGRLNRIPALLEDIVLGKAQDAHRSLCAIELDEDSIVANSVEESIAWEEFFAVRADRRMSPKHHLLSKEIEACLVAIYRDPSFGREPLLSKSMGRYADTCEWARREGVVIEPGATMRAPGRVDSSVLAFTRAMRDDCADELYRTFQESKNELPKPDSMRLPNND